MAKLTTNGIEIEYDTFGSADDRPLLLIMGLGAQMILWDEVFCEGLAAAGHHVIRFDNRDIGLSTKLDGVRAPNMLEIGARMMAGEPVEVPDTLDDMADDAAGVLDELGIDSAHVCGASMGGMIAQTLTIRHPERIRSLTSIMSTTGDPSLPPSSPEAMGVLTRPPARSRDEAIEFAVLTQRTIGGKGFPFDEERIRARAARNYDRSFYPEGIARQISAIVAHGNRQGPLEKLRLPCLVVHGDQDPLVPVEGGRATAAAIEDAEFMLVEGMGHDMPQQTWDLITESITKMTKRAEN